MYLQKSLSSFFISCAFQNRVHIFDFFIITNFTPSLIFDFLNLFFVSLLLASILKCLLVLHYLLFFFIPIGPVILIVSYPTLTSFPSLLFSSFLFSQYTNFYSQIIVYQYWFIFPVTSYSPLFLFVFIRKNFYQKDISIFRIYFSMCFILSLYTNLHTFPHKISCYNIS